MLRSRTFIVLGGLAGIFLILLACILIRSARNAASPATEVVAGGDSALVSTVCGFYPPEDIQARCYRFASGGFTLPVVVLSPPDKKSDEPLLYLEGGPGTDNTTTGYILNDWLRWLQTTPLHRDLVLASTRGLAPGHPAWRCEAYTDISRQTLAANLSYAQETERIQPVLEQCIDEFDQFLKGQTHPAQDLDGQSQANLSVASLNTTVYARDLSSMMTALGYQQWHLLGSSYGTRLAMVMAASDPAVKKVILDSPYPLGSGALDDALLVWARAFESLFKRFEADDLRGQFRRLSLVLKEKPVTIEVPDWSGGKPIKIVLTHERLAGVLYSAMYSSEFYYAIPKAVEALLAGDTEPVAWLAELAVNMSLDPDFNAMIYYATECNDNPVISKEQYRKALAKYPMWLEGFAQDWDNNICRHPAFAGPKLPAEIKLQQPVMIASGALDPITDATYVGITRQQAPNHLVIEQEQNSHAEFIFSECGKSLIPWFLSLGTDLPEAEFQSVVNSCNPAAAQ